MTPEEIQTQAVIATEEHFATVEAERRRLIVETLRASANAIEAGEPLWIGGADVRENEQGFRHHCVTAVVVRRVADPNLFAGLPPVPPLAGERETLDAVTSSVLGEDVGGRDQS